MKSIIFALLISQTEEVVPASVIQAKIDRAAPNDVVELPEGTVNGCLLITRPVILRGRGQTKTILRGNLDCTVLTIRVRKKDDEVKIERLQITNGGWNIKSPDRTVDVPAGGVYINGAAHVVIEHALIWRNEQGLASGGIYLQNGRMTIRDSEIRENTYDGGIRASIGTTLDIERTIIANNHARYEDGGLSFVGKTLRLREVSFEDNTIEDGEGVHLALGTRAPKIMNVIMENVRFSSTARRAIKLEGTIKLRMRNTNWPADVELPPGTEIVPD